MLAWGANYTALFVFLFFFFFLYHAFIVFRYKKLHAVLAMEKTKPINQKQNTKETILSGPPLHTCAGKPIAKTFTNKY